MASSVGFCDEEEEAYGATPDENGEMGNHPAQVPLPKVREHDVNRKNQTMETGSLCFKKTTE